MKKINPEDEISFLKYYLPIDSRIVTFSVIFLGLAVWIFYFSDLMFIGLTKGFIFINIVRIIFTLFSFYIAYLSLSNRNIEIFEDSVFIWWILFIAIGVLTNFSRPLSHSSHFTVYALAIMGMYFVPPNKFFYQIVPAISFTTINLIFIFFLNFSGLPVTTKVSISFSYLIANVFGIFLSRKLNELKEYQYENYKIQENLKNEYKKLNENKDKFFSIISHDIRTPFITYYSYTKMLAEENEALSQSELKTIYNKLFYSSRKMYALLENLLNWASVESGNFKIKIESLELKKLVDYILKFIDDIASAKKLHIQNNIPSDFRINCDEEILTIVIRNLISNAIKFSYEGEIIEIAVRKEGEKVIISITDYGTGIKQEDMQKLFSIDKKYSMPGTTGETGNGLGLILSNGLIKLLAGEITFESKPGKGSVFFINLPSKMIN